MQRFTEGGGSKRVRLDFDILCLGFMRFIFLCSNLHITQWSIIYLILSIDVILIIQLMCSLQDLYISNVEKDTQENPFDSHSLIGFVWSSDLKTIALCVSIKWNNSVSCCLRLKLKHVCVSMERNLCTSCMCVYHHHHQPYHQAYKDVISACCVFQTNEKHHANHFPRVRNFEQTQ